MKIIIASDHAGFANKQTLIQQLKAFGFDMIDAGTFTDGSCHYPEYALAAAERVAAKEATFGVLICGSGIGVSIAANKVKGARCAVGYHDEATKRARIDNDANLIAFGASIVISTLHVSNNLPRRCKHAIIARGLKSCSVSQHKLASAGSTPKYHSRLAIPFHSCGAGSVSCR